MTCSFVPPLSFRGKRQTAFPGCACHLWVWIQQGSPAGRWLLVRSVRCPRTRDPLKGRSGLERRKAHRVYRRKRHRRLAELTNQATTLLCGRSQQEPRLACARLDLASLLVMSGRNSEGGSVRCGPSSLHFRTPKSRYRHA